MKDTSVYIDHVLESITLIEKFTTNITQAEFLQNKEKQYAVMKAIEIIGEAIKKIPLEKKEPFSEINWKDVVGTRDILIHSYFSVDPYLVWDIIEKDIPKLKTTMLKMLKEL